jgi:hypothetical protein
LEADTAVIGTARHQKTETVAEHLFPVVSD